MNYAASWSVKLFLLTTLLIFSSFYSYSQAKEIDVASQVENLILSLDEWSFTDKKIELIEARIVAIPEEELEQSDIPKILDNFNGVKEKNKRFVSSTEHYLNSIGAKVEISNEKFQSYSQGVKSHISSVELYKIVE